MRLQHEEFELDDPGYEQMHRTVEQSIRKHAGHLLVTHL